MAGQSANKKSHLLGSGAETFDRLGFGALVTAADGTVLEANDTARGLAIEAFGSWPSSPTCCGLLGCRRREPLARNCITELASSSAEPLPELRVDLPAGRPTHAVWATAVRTAGKRSPVLIHLRRAAMRDRRKRSELHWMAGPRLRIRGLGRTRIETEETAVEGRWLLQRPGLLLKYLVCQRGRPAHVDEIADALWPSSGEGGRSSVRYFVHSLRQLLEPYREPHSQSAFIVSVKGTYALDMRVELDLDDFEALTEAGFRLSRGAEPGKGGIAMLEEAMALYRGDLFAEEPFAAWAFPERERMRSQARRALEMLVDHHRDSGQPSAALDYLERFADLWPLDNGVQRSLLGHYLQLGRRSDAQRRYAAFRTRLFEEFREKPGFELSDLAAGNGR